MLRQHRLGQKWLSFTFYANINHESIIGIAKHNVTRYLSWDMLILLRPVKSIHNTVNIKAIWQDAV